MPPYASLARRAVAERVLVIALGELAPEAAAAAVRDLVGAAALDWLDRAELRRRPLATIARLRRRRFAAAVLVAPDLNQRRLVLTSMVLALPAARARWRCDLAGRKQPFSIAAHLRRHGLALARHLLACGLARVFGEPALRVLERVLPPPRPLRRPPARVRRLLYLRSQLWLGLTGGGSVAHTAGVIGGLGALGVNVRVVSSDRLAGVAAATHVVPPEVWFDGAARDLEELTYNVSFLRAALRVAQAFRPDVIYQRHSAFNIAGAVLSRLRRVPLVLEFNSSEVWKGKYWGGLHLVRAARLVERINLRTADRIVVVSRALHDSLVADGVPPNKIILNPNGVDPCQFRPDAPGGAVRQRYGLGEALVVGFSGTFGLWHGIPTLAAAIPSVLADHPETFFLLIGDGPLAGLVDGLGPRVIRTGLVPHGEMPGHLAACDILLSPHGRQADGAEFFGSPTKLYEYMAAGRPIVASAVGQIADVLQDGETALLVPPDDVEALCGAIGRLLNDRDLRARLGSAARQAAVARHTWRHNGERLLASVSQSG